MNSSIYQDVALVDKFKRNCSDVLQARAFLHDQDQDQDRPEVVSGRLEDNNTRDLNTRGTQWQRPVV